MNDPQPPRGSRLFHADPGLLLLDEDVTMGSMGAADDPFAAEPILNGSWSAAGERLRVHREPLRVVVGANAEGGRPAAQAGEPLRVGPAAHGSLDPIAVRLESAPTDPSFGEAGTARRAADWARSTSPSSAAPHVLARSPVWDASALGDEEESENEPVEGPHVIDDVSGEIVSPLRFGIRPDLRAAPRPPTSVRVPWRSSSGDHEIEGEEGASGEVLPVRRSPHDAGMSGEAGAENAEDAEDAGAESLQVPAFGSHENDSLDPGDPPAWGAQLEPLPWEPGEAGADAWGEELPLEQDLKGEDPTGQIAGGLPAGERGAAAQPAARSAGGLPPLAQVGMGALLVLLVAVVVVQLIEPPEGRAGRGGAARHRTASTGDEASGAYAVDGTAPVAGAAGGVAKADVEADANGEPDADAKVDVNVGGAPEPQGSVSEWLPSDDASRRQRLSNLDHQGLLEIVTDRPARVWVGGLEIGTTPLSPVALPQGTYDVKVMPVGGGRAVFEGRVRVDASRVRQINFELAER